MPASAIVSSDCFHASINWRYGPERSLMELWTGILSTTDHTRPAASISPLRLSTSCSGHASPLYLSCKAVTIPLAPVCLIWSSEIGSCGPNHRHVSFIIVDHWRHSSHQHCYPQRGNVRRYQAE